MRARPDQRQPGAEGQGEADGNRGRRELREAVPPADGVEHAANGQLATQEVCVLVLRLCTCL